MFSRIPIALLILRDLVHKAKQKKTKNKKQNKTQKTRKIRG